MKRQQSRSWRGRNRVELFEQIRREREFGGATIRGIARKLGVHRRVVRQALVSALPPARKRPERERPQIGVVAGLIDDILEADQRAPRKQRHTAHRIWQRVRAEYPQQRVGESTVRRYVRQRKREMGLAKRETFVPQVYEWGQEAQVDWYEASAELDGVEQVVQVFSMRSMASGAAFHRAYPRATQQAFLEAHELAFEYFGGVFRVLRYDNLASAVKKILRGYERELTERFIAFRSHWRFEAEFCNPARGNEKGGVEGEVGRFRRQHWVPVPKARDLAALNEQLLAGCRQDEQRRIAGRAQRVGEALETEREHLLPLAEDRFDLAEISFPTVDSKGCVKVRSNWYSAPLTASSQVQAKVYSAYVEIWQEGRCVARHERNYQRGRQVLDLEHYLEVLERKPGALAGSAALEQWRQQGRWPESYDRLWEQLRRRQGKVEGTREMVELLQLGRRHGYTALKRAIEWAMEAGAGDAAAVRYRLNELVDGRPSGCEAVRVEKLTPYERPLPSVADYDQLLEVRV